VAVARGGRATGNDGDDLLAVDRVGDRRPLDRNPGVDLPQLGQAVVAVGRHRTVEIAAEHHAAGGVEYARQILIGQLLLVDNFLGIDVEGNNRSGRVRLIHSAGEDLVHAFRVPASGTNPRFRLDVDVGAAADA